MDASAFQMQHSRAYVALSKAINKLLVVEDMDYLARESDIWQRILNSETHHE